MGNTTKHTGKRHTQTVDRLDDEYGTIECIFCRCGARRRIMRDLDGNVLDDSKWVEESNGIIYERAGRF